MNQLPLSHPLARSCDRDDRRPGIFGHWRFILAPDRAGQMAGSSRRALTTRSRYEVPAASFPKPCPEPWDILSTAHVFFFFGALSGLRRWTFLMMMFKARGLEFA